MSADNAIFIVNTSDNKYVAAMVFNVEEYQYDNLSFLHRFFKDVDTVFGTEAKAFEYAYGMFKCFKNNQIEYGVRFINTIYTLEEIKSYTPSNVFDWSCYAV